MRREVGLGCTLVAIALVAVLACVGCGSSSVAGKYVSQTSKSDVLTLNSDGTFALVEGGVNAKGTYKVNGGKITLTLTQPSGYPAQTGTISGNTITDPQGAKWVKG
jgi:hypothetical protein